MIAGVDVRVLRNKDRVFCAIVTLSYPGGELIEIVDSESGIDYPYVPGLLTFREGPVVLKCFRKLRSCPDILMFDGQGYAHPRRMGLATHMGIVLDIPSIGCAKSKLIGCYRQPGKRKGDYSLIHEDDEVIGAALRSRDNTKPVFVSAGHRISLASSIKITKFFCKTRIPEPTKLAHNYLKSRY